MIPVVTVRELFLPEISSRNNMKEAILRYLRDLLRLHFCFKTTFALYDTSVTRLGDTWPLWQNLKGLCQLLMVRLVFSKF